MYLFIIIIIIAVVFSIIMGIRNDLGSGVASFLGTIFIGVCILTIISVFVEQETKISKIWSNDLISLKDVSSIDGDFFLGIGTFQTNSDYIYFYRDENNNWIKKASVNTYECNIILDKSETPKIEYYDRRPINNRKWLFNIGDYNRESYYLIYLPPNSIYKGFEIDLN